MDELVDLIELPKILPKNYSYYDNLGRIIVNYFGTVVEEMDRLYPQYQRIDGRFSGADYYIINGIPTIRLPQETSFDKTELVADGVDTIHITFPYTGTITFRGPEILVADISGNETFTTTVAGTYYVSIDAFPYLPISTTIKAI